MDIALFLDWCSLYQGPDRTDQEQQSFKRALKAVNLWYAHRLTFVWMLTVVPDGVKAYSERGWPCFERAVATLLKSRGMVLDLGINYNMENGVATYDTVTKTTGRRTDGDKPSYKHMVHKCLGGRPAPCTPIVFRKKLKDLHFTNGADRSFVLDKFVETFTEVIGAADDLDYMALGWGDDEACAVAEALPWCRRVENLELSFNKIRDDGARAILEALKENPNIPLKTLALNGNPISFDLKASLQQEMEARGGCVIGNELWARGGGLH